MQDIFCTETFSCPLLESKPLNGGSDSKCGHESTFSKSSGRLNIELRNISLSAYLPRTDDGSVPRELAFLMLS